mgnify:CR=1 FL=1
MAHLASLARIDLSDAELDRMVGELGTIISSVEAVQQAPIDGVEPMSHPMPIVNVTRPDEVRPSLTPEQALAMALRTHHERIKLFERMAENATAHGQHHAAAKWTAAAEEARGHVDMLRTVLSNQSPAGGITPEAG